MPNVLTLILFLIITLEGYVVLSSELLAIRLTVPFVGSGTDTVSVVIAAVLMPLAFGYHAGGRFKPGVQRLFPLGGKQHVSVREKLIFNMVASLCFLLFALSYSFVKFFFEGLQGLGIHSRVILTTLYAGIFIAPPTYLLAQTIPLVCNFFSGRHLPKITSRILFFSTIGSFLGAVFSTLVLMPHIGVHYTAGLNFIILALLIAFLSKDLLSLQNVFVATLAIAGVVNNSWPAMRQMFIVENNQYNVITVQESGGFRHMMINNNASSRYNDRGRKHLYNEFIEEQVLWRAPEERMPMDILVIGAGAFTFGAEDTENNFTFVDIDESLKRVSEENILQRPLNKNVTFHAKPARGFLNSTEQKYDAIVLDAFSGSLTAPEQLITQEFFQEVKDHLKDGGIMISNTVADSNFAAEYSRHLDNTMRSVFPHMSRHILAPNYDLWNDEVGKIYNVIYMYRNHEGADDSKTIYSDTKNRAFIDLP